MTGPAPGVRGPRREARAGALLSAAVLLLAASPAPAQDATRLEVARELAQVMVDDASRRAVDRQVGVAMAQVIGASLQARLNRPLVEDEWRTVSDVVSRFIGEALPPGRTREIAARVYARHFDEAELRELLRFQRSEVGRKAARLAPVIGNETAQAIDQEIRDSPRMAGLLEELERAFPVLKFRESP